MPAHLQQFIPHFDMVTTHAHQTRNSVRRIGHTPLAGKPKIPSQAIHRVSRHRQLVCAHPGARRRDRGGRLAACHFIAPARLFVPQGRGAAGSRGALHPRGDRSQHSAGDLYRGSCRRSRRYPADHAFRPLDRGCGNFCGPCEARGGGLQHGQLADLRHHTERTGNRVRIYRGRARRQRSCRCPVLHRETGCRHGSRLSSVRPSLLEFGHFHGAGQRLY